MKAYDSLTPQHELYRKEWINFIEATTCECLVIMNLVFLIESSFLIETMDLLQKV